MFNLNTIIIVTLVFFGFMFISSSLSKMMNFSHHVKTIHAYQVLPDNLVGKFAKIDVALEIIIGVGLLTLHFSSLFLIMSACLLTVYTIAIGINLFRGRTDIDCGCGGIVGENKISYKLIARNIILVILMALSLIYVQNSSVSFSEVYVISLLMVIQIFYVMKSISKIKSFKQHYESLGGNYE